MYKPKTGDPFYVGLRSLELMWLCKPYTGNERLLVYLFRTAVGLSLIIFLQIGPILHIVMVASVYESIKMSEALSHLVGGFGFSLVYFKMSLYHHRCGAVGVLIYGALIFYENRHGVCERLQQETDQNLFCCLFYPSWLPVNISRPVIFTIQTVISMGLYTPGGQVCLLIYESTFILISHIEFLLDHLDAAFCEKDQRKRSWMLKYCIQYHMHISKMGEGIGSLHQTFTGHMAVIWAASLGCICNQMLHSKLLGALLYLLGYLFTCCCLVEAGQTLLNKSESLADKLYNIPWYLGTINDQKCVMFMIRRAQVPMKLTATPFGNYDCRFFIMIIKTAYSYLTLLQKAKKGDSFYIGLKCLEMMWMFKPDPREEGPLVYLFRTAMSLIYIVFLQIGPLLHFIMVAAKYEVGVSDALADTIGGLGFTLVYFKILVYHHRISTVFKNLVDHEMFGKPRTFDAVKRRCEMLALFILGYCPIGVFIYGAVIIHESRNSVCLLMYESAFSLISHIEFLMDQIDAAFCEGNEKKRFWLLRYCAEYHMHISKMGKDVSSLHETLTGHLAVIWAVSFGCIFNQVIEVVQYSMVYSYRTGTEIRNAYDNKSPNTNKAVSNAFRILRLRIFIMIIKTAYSYLTLLQNVVLHFRNFSNRC
nr:unnamed protein product [Callosobruchus chinensis]